MVMMTSLKMVYRVTGFLLSFLFHLYTTRVTMWLLLFLLEAIASPHTLLGICFGNVLILELLINPFLVMSADYQFQNQDIPKIKTFPKLRNLGNITWYLFEVQPSSTCPLPGPPQRRQRIDTPGSALAHELLWDVSRGEPRLQSHWPTRS